MAKVSIIMSLFNKAGELYETLLSVEKQTYKHWELIIVDDGSTDSSLEIAELFKDKNPLKCIIVNSGKPQTGAAACRNKGLQLASGEYIIFLDADDVLEPFCLQQRVEVMQFNPSLDWAIFNQYRWHDDVKHPKLYNRKISDREEAIQYFLRMDSPWQTMAPVWKSSALQKLGGFDEELYFMEDPYLHLTALLDEELIVDFKTNFPADSFYRMPEFSSGNSEKFYTNSIKSRFIFISKTVELLNEKASREKLPMYFRHLRNGFIDFVKVMLASRIKDFEQQFNEAVSFLRNQNILTRMDRFKLVLLKNIYLSDSKIISLFKLRGIVYRIV